jgi:hypothetical protein
MPPSPHHDNVSLCLCLCLSPVTVINTKLQETESFPDNKESRGTEGQSQTSITKITQNFHWKLFANFDRKLPKPCQS